MPISGLVFNISRWFALLGVFRELFSALDG
jgi:hypothetical protein